MSRSLRATCWTTLVVMLAAGICWADVLAPEQSTIARSGLPVQFRLSLESPEAVAGIQGQLNYDSTLFSSPQVLMAMGSVGFNVLGNEVTPGEFRFVIYADPTANLMLGPAVAEFMLQSNSSLPYDQPTTIYYSMEAAARPDGTSFLDAVSFGDVEVLMNRAGVEHWLMYE